MARMPIIRTERLMSPRRRNKQDPFAFLKPKRSREGIFSQIIDRASLPEIPEDKRASQTYLTGLETPGFSLADIPAAKHIHKPDLSPREEFSDMVHQNRQMICCYNEINKFMHLAKIEHAIVKGAEAKEKSQKNFKDNR